MDVGALPSVLALIWGAQVLGRKTQAGTGQVLERDAARDSTSGPVGPVPVKDQHPGRSASVDGRDHRGPGLMRGGESAKDLVRRDQPKGILNGSIDRDAKLLVGLPGTPAGLDTGPGPPKRGRGGADSRMHFVRASRRAVRR